MESQPVSIPPEFLASMQRRLAISQVTNNEEIKGIWERWHERTPGRIDLVIRGNIQWRSEANIECNVGVGWIRPNALEPSNADTSFQLSMPPYEYGAGIPVEKALSEEKALPILRDAVNKASFMTDTLSFLTGFSATWRPARILSVLDAPGPSFHDGVERHYKKYFAMPLSAESTSAVVTDDMIAGIYRSLLTSIWSLPTKLRRVLETAISWQAQANRVPGFSRYVHYWASIELLASFFWEHLPAGQTGRVPESEVHQQILKHLLDLSSKNYTDIIRKSADLLQPSARKQIQALSKLINFDADVFFGKKSKDAKNLIEIRNDIAHGNVSNDDRVYADTYHQELQKYSDTTRDFVIRVAVAAAKGELALAS